MPESAVDLPTHLVDETRLLSRTQSKNSGKFSGRADYCLQFRECGASEMNSTAALGMLLRLKGHDIRVAHDGLEALSAAEDFHPELVLLDIGLPKLNGYEVAQRMRLQSWGRQAVLVVLTGWGQDEDCQRSLAAGFNLHVVKPVEMAALEKLLTEFAAPAQ